MKPEEILLPICQQSMTGNQKARPNLHPSAHLLATEKLGTSNVGNGHSYHEINELKAKNPILPSFPTPQVTAVSKSEVARPNLGVLSNQNSQFNN